MNRLQWLCLALVGADYDTSLLQLALNLKAPCPAIFPDCAPLTEICGQGPELLKLSGSEHVA